MDRRELAAFLRSGREHITPGEVGLPAGALVRSETTSAEVAVIVARVMLAGHGPGRSRPTPGPSWTGQIVM